MGIIESPALGSSKFRKGDKVAVLPLIPCKKCLSCVQKKYFHCKRYNFLGSRCDGGFAEVVQVPQENLFLLPSKLDERVGAFLEPISVALHVVKRSGFEQSGRAMVFGAGPIGLLTGMWLKIFGASEVVVTDVREQSLEIARKAGFEKVFHVDDNDLAKHDAFDHCFEAAGANAALLKAIDRARNCGTVTVVGRDTKDTIIPLSQYEQFMRKEIILNGCWGYDNLGQESLIRESLGKFNISALITAEITLKEGEEVIPKMFNREMFFCKVLIRIQRS